MITLNLLILFCFILILLGFLRTIFLESVRFFISKAFHKPPTNLIQLLAKQIKLSFLISEPYQQKEIAMMAHLTKQRSFRENSVLFAFADLGSLFWVFWVAMLFQFSSIYWGVLGGVIFSLSQKWGRVVFLLAITSFIFEHSSAISSQFAQQPEVMDLVLFLSNGTAANLGFIFVLGLGFAFLSNGFFIMLTFILLGLSGFWLALNSAVFILLGFSLGSNLVLWRKLRKVNPRVATISCGGVLQSIFALMVFIPIYVYFRNFIQVDASMILIQFSGCWLVWVAVQFLVAATYGHFQYHYYQNHPIQIDAPAEIPDVCRKWKTFFTHVAAGNNSK